MSKMFKEMDQVPVEHKQAQRREALHDNQHQDRVMMNLTQIKARQTRASPYLTIRTENRKSRERNRRNFRYIILATTIAS